MYLPDFASFRIRQEAWFVSDPVDVHPFARNAFDRHLGITGTIILFHETVVVLVELRLTIAVRMLLPVLDPAISDVDLAAFFMDTVIVVLKVRYRNLFPLEILGWIDQILNCCRSHCPKFVQCHTRCFVALQDTLRSA